MFGVKEIDSQALAQALQADPDAYRLVDVRGPGEWAQGVIDGAELVPLHVVPLKIELVDARRPIVFYCRSGARSAQACAFMMSRGQDSVINLRGGILDWLNKGLPLTPAAA